MPDVCVRSLLLDLLQVLPVLSVCIVRMVHGAHASAHERHLLTGLDMELSMTNLCLHTSGSPLNYLIYAHDDAKHLSQHV